MEIMPFVKSLGLQNISIVRSLYNRIRRMKMPNKDIILPLDDLRILVRNPRQSFIGRSLYLEGIWERKETQFLPSVVKPGMTILDIGADIGYYTLLFAKLVGQGRVFSFEPIPKAKWYLDYNIELNCLQNVRTLSFALFDKTGEVCLEDPFTKSKINLSKKNISENDIIVEMKVYDDWKYEEGIDHLDLVKIDVEGAELNILKGMKDTLESDGPGLLIEVHPQQLESFGFSATDLIEFLQNFGYRFEPIDKTKLDFSEGNITIFCESGRTDK